MLAMLPSSCAARGRLASFGLFALAASVGLLARQACSDANQAPDLDAASERFASGSLPELHEFLSIPNDAHKPEAIANNRAWVRAAFERRGFAVNELETEGEPLLLAQATSSSSRETVLVYLQIDGQPVDSSRWDQPDPFTPALKRMQGQKWQVIEWARLEEPDRDPNWRIFARSASDAKGPVMMFLAAWDAVRDADFQVPYGVKVIMDFEEELGSPNLPGAVRRHRGALAADMLVICDGPRHPSNRPTLTFGARGIATVRLNVFGPRTAQHSGHYGNYVPNPAQRLAGLLASMKDDDGRVTIDGFYDGVELDADTRAALAETPDDEPQMLRMLGIARPDAVAATYQESIQYPSLNVRGMRAGWVDDEVRTIIPESAVAEIDIRLVPESQPERLISLLREHIVGRGYHLTKGPPSDTERAQYDRIASFSYEVSYGSFRTSVDHGVGDWLRRAMVRAFGEPPVQKRISGGSVPISPFVQTLGVLAVTVPTVNADNNQHSPNENLRVGNYFDGVKTFLAILTEPIDG